MAKSILDILIKTSTSGEKKPSELSKSLIGLKQTIGTAGVAFAAFAGAAYVVDKALDATVGKYVEYGLRVKDTSRLLGLSAEETSRVIALTDDLGISYEDLNSAIKKNADDTNFSIDGLAAASAEYLSLGSAQDRAAFAQKNYGKQWAEFSKLLEKGPDQVRAMAAAVDEGHLFDDADLKRIEDYRIKTDQLHDTWEGFSMMLGEKAIPVVIDQMNAILDNTRAHELVIEQGKKWMFLTLQQQQALVEQATAEREAAEATGEHAEATDDLLASAEELSAEYKNLIDLTIAWVGADDKAKRKMAYNNIMAKLSVDGLTKAEKQMGDAAGLALGIIDQNAINAAGTLEDLGQQFIDGKITAQQYAAALNAIPKSILINVSTVWTSSGAGSSSGVGGGSVNINMATGGAFDAGMPMKVHKDEILVPDYGGVVLTRTDAMRLMEGSGAGNGGGKNVTFYGAVTFVVQGSVMDVLDELS